jgi:hypothetical protein
VTESYRLDAGKSTPRGDPPAADRPDPMEPTCPACGSRLRYRGRRKSVTVWSCEASDCPTVLVEMLDHGTPIRRGGRRG